MTDRAGDQAAPRNPGNVFFKTEIGLQLIKQAYSKEVSLVLCSSVNQRAGQEQRRA